MQYILALDQGTTSSRAIIFDQSGTIRAVAQKELRPLFPQPGWVEQDPAEIWSSQVSVVTEVLYKAGLSAKDIAAIGITNQRETTVVWDRKTGQPICNAIVWQDRRTADVCMALKRDGKEEVFQNKTGLVIDAYFSGTKLAWILDHVPDARAKAEAGALACGTVDSWLVWRLTKGRYHLTDVTNASRTLLYNIHTGEWDDELLDILDIPHQLLYLKSALPARSMRKPQASYGRHPSQLLALPAISKPPCLARCVPPQAWSRIRMGPAVSC